MQHFRPERDTIDDETNRNNETKLRPILIRSPVKPNHGVYRRLAGAKLGATDDTDWYGLYIPPPISVLGLEREEHFVFTTGGKPGGNGPPDVDVCLYTLMKWARLAAKGNPSALHFRTSRVHDPDVGRGLSFAKSSGRPASLAVTLSY